MPNNPTAFPARNYIVPRDLAAQHVHALGDTQGMTLRDYFAAHAFADVAGRFSWEPEQIEKAAEMAYALADALLRAREKGGK